MLSTYDAILLADSEEEFSRMVSRFDDVFRWRRLIANASKNKVLIFKTDGQSEWNICLEREELQVVDYIRHL